MRRWSFVLVAVLGLVILGGIVAAIASDRDWDGRDRWHDDEVTRVVGANGEETIIVHDNDRPFFFPGILFVPLFFLFFFGIARAIFWRGRGPWGGGPWNGGPGGPGAGYAPPWFDEWHRRSHAGNVSPPTDAPTAAPKTTKE
jgi:hypothetical protein